MNKLLSIVFVLVWMVVIFSFSRQDATESSETSGPIVEKVEEVVETITQQPAPETLGQLVRKGAHVFIYLVLGAFVVDALSYHPLKRKTILISAYLITLVYAISDEIHQYYIPGRSGEARDVLIDMVGATIGIFIMLYLKQRVNEKPIQQN